MLSSKGLDCLMGMNIDLTLYWMLVKGYFFEQEGPSAIWFVFSLTKRTLCLVVYRLSAVLKKIQYFPLRTIYKSYQETYINLMKLCLNGMLL